MGGGELWCAVGGLAPPSRGVFGGDVRLRAAAAAPFVRVDPRAHNDDTRAIVRGHWHARGSCVRVRSLRPPPPLRAEPAAVSDVRAAHHRPPCRIVGCVFGFGRVCGRDDEGRVASGEVRRQQAPTRAIVPLPEIARDGIVVPHWGANVARTHSELHRRRRHRQPAPALALSRLLVPPPPLLCLHCSVGLADVEIIMKRHHDVVGFLSCASRLPLMDRWESFRG